MAIAFDSSTTAGNTGSTSLTFAFNNVAGNVVFAAFTANKLIIPAVSSVEYAGQALTASPDTPQNPPANVTVKTYLYSRLSPATGNNNMVITFASTTDETRANAISYSGVGSLPQNMFTTGTGTTATLTTTTTIDNSWLVGLFRNDNDGDGAAGSGTTKRSFVDGQNGFYDTGGAKTPIGSYSIISTAGSAAYCAVGLSMAPPVAAGPANLKSFDGNVKANIKSYNGNVLANIKSMNGNS